MYIAKKVVILNKMFLSKNEWRNLKGLYEKQNEK
jgi:hypothetical protein